MDNHLNLSLDELYELEELDLIFQDKRFAEIILAVTTHPFNPEYSSRVIHPGFRELEPDSELMKEIRLSAIKILRERKTAIERDLEQTLAWVLENYVSQAQLKTKNRERHCFDTIDSYLSHLCQKHIPRDVMRGIGEKNPTLWANLNNYRKPNWTPPYESPQTITMHSFFRGFSDGKQIRRVYLITHRIKRDKRIAQKIARETEDAEAQRKKDKKTETLKSPEEYLEKAIINDIAGFSIITPDVEHAHELKERLISCFEVLEIKDYYQEPRAGSLPDYRAIHALVKYPYNHLQPDPIRLHILSLEDHLDSAIGAASRQVFIAREGSGRGKLYTNLVGQITELLG